MDLDRPHASVENMLREAIEAAVGRAPVRVDDMAAHGTPSPVTFAALFPAAEVAADGHHERRDAQVTEVARTVAAAFNGRPYTDFVFDWVPFARGDGPSHLRHLDNRDDLLVCKCTSHVQWN